MKLLKRLAALAAAALFTGAAATTAYAREVRILRAKVRFPSP